jgi:uncharacterized membrane protein
VPNLSVTIAIMLAASSLGVLIYFIHHIARSMQASQVIAAVSHDVSEGIEALFPAELGQGEAHEPLPPDVDADALTVCAKRDGYIQFIYGDQLMSLARECDVVIRLTCRPGDFVMRGSPLARVVPAHKAGDEDAVAKRLRGAISLGSERTQLQDLRYSLDQLVEVALRAMSPGINDPFTAITCIDRLGGALNRLAGRTFPSPQRFDDDDGGDGRLRVIVPPVTFDGVLDASIPPIRDHACRLASDQVSRHLRGVLLAVAALTTHVDRRDALVRHAAAIDETQAPPAATGCES